MTFLDVLLIVLLVGSITYIIVLHRRYAQVHMREIKRSEERRSSFISIISHQLRTPLSIIKGYLEALATGDQGKLNEGQQEYVDEALKINEDSVALVNDYLSAVHMDIENVEVHPESVDLTEMIESELQKLKPITLASNSSLSFNSPPEPVPSVHADRIKIQQVIENILTNAIKYSGGKGEIVVALQRHENEVEFSCKDNGVGIPRDQMREVFSRFYRGSNVIQKNTQGSGLGLYLARIIVTALGGKIWLESAENKGTTVYFRLPITKSS